MLEPTPGRYAREIAEIKRSNNGVRAVRRRCRAGMQRTSPAIVCMASQANQNSLWLCSRCTSKLSLRSNSWKPSRWPTGTCWRTFDCMLHARPDAPWSFLAGDSSGHDGLRLQSNRRRITTGQARFWVLPTHGLVAALNALGLLCLVAACNQTEPSKGYVVFLNPELEIRLPAGT